MELLATNRRVKRHPISTTSQVHGIHAETEPDITIFTQGSIPLKMETLILTKKIKLTKQVFEFFQEFFTK